MFVNPFFRLKIGRFKATVHRVAHPSMLKQGSDPAEFATTWHLPVILWRPLALRATVSATVGMSRTAQKKIRQNLPAVAYRGKPLGPTVGILRTSQRDMPTVGQTIALSATVGKLEAESWQNLPDQNQLLHLWMLYCTDRSFATGDFLTEKGSAVIILGLNYCSMGSSHSLSCDTVP
jgi:hypothetical protein